MPATQRPSELAMRSPSFENDTGSTRGLAAVQSVTRVSRASMRTLVSARVIMKIHGPADVPEYAAAPERWDVLVNLGAIASEAGRYADAERRYREALAIEIDAFDANVTRGDGREASHLRLVVDADAFVADLGAERILRLGHRVVVGALCMSGGGEKCRESHWKVATRFHREIPWRKRRADYLAVNPASTVIIDPVM